MTEEKKESLEKFNITLEYFKFFRDELYNEIEEYMNGTREAFNTPKGQTYSSERPECCSELLPKPKFFMLQQFLMFIDEVAKKDNYKFTYSLKYRED
jgi:hypothetical protein